MTSTPDQETLDQLFESAYTRLRTLAGAFYEQEHAERTFSPTVVVHEAYLSLRNSEPDIERGSEYFFACAATAMRRYMLDAARARASLKRGGGVKRLSLEHPIEDHRDPLLIDILSLDDALCALEQESERAAKVAEFRLFSGMEIAGIARVLQVSPRTVNIDWRFARVFLQSSLSEATNATDQPAPPTV